MWWMLALWACGGGADLDTRRRAAPTGAEPSPTFPPHPPADPTTTPTVGEPLGAPATLDTATVAALTDAIDDLLAGTTHGALIVDAENGEVVYTSNADLPLKPASNTKLYTTAAAMHLLGEDARYLVEAYAPAAPVGGAIASLTVRVEHDSSWSDYVYADAAFVADRIADGLAAAGVQRVTGTLTLAGELCVDGSSVGTYDASWHRALGVGVLEDALVARGISVGGTTTSSSFSQPAGVRLFARESPPLHVLDTPLNVYSHNEMADLASRHLGYALYGVSSYEEGELAILDAARDLGVDTTPLHFADGSGLSHDNRVTAQTTVDLLAAMEATPAGLAWERTFAVAGVSGTLVSRMTGADTLGRFHGKTGTLWDTIALSGVLHHAYDGHRYRVSILQNDVPDQTEARALADAVVALVGTDLRGIARPDAPVLTSVTDDGGGLSVTWAPAAGATTYAVWSSSDGLVWDRAATTVTSETSLHLPVPVGQRAYVRVTAQNGAAWSAASDVGVGARTADGPRILVVDANDRWDAQWENPLLEGHDFARITAEVIADRALAFAANEAVLNGSIALGDYDAVVWMAGEESSEDLSFDPTEQAQIADYLAAGGSLLVSGAEIGWDLEAIGTPESAAFYHDWLHAAYVGDDAATFSVAPTPGGLFDGLPELGFYTPARMVVDWPDQLAPTAGATAALDYLEGAGGTAAVAFAGDHRVVTLGFPFESIDARGAREAVMDRILAWLGV
jgi:D-alanyl-D-alanine carboxypeptidase/D-alanyl-D-alanine-endopeptidase (penicillin-binding protein 4)